MKLDILAFGAHPDDVEIGAGGTLAKAAGEGKRTGIIDLTRGELGTRGSADLRDQEAAKASEILGLTVRENLALADGFFQDNRETRMQIIEKVRTYQPEVVICNSVEDRHPDHARAANLVAESCFLSGLRKIENGQEAWRPRTVLHIIQDYDLNPSIIIDIDGYMDQKMNSILAYSSQFYNPNSDEPETPISGQEFLDAIRGRAAQYGRRIGTGFGEGFTMERPPGVKSIFDIY